MCGRLLLALFVFVCLPVYFLAAEQQYIVTESQLQNIEKSLQRLEQDRRNWQQQAAELNSEAVNLNGQLHTEQEQYKTLQKSFDKFEASRLKEKSEMAAKIIKLETTNRLKDKLLVCAGIALFLSITVPFIIRRLKR